MIRSLRTRLRDSDRRSSQERMRERSAFARDIYIPPPADVARRLEYEADTPRWLSYYLPNTFKRWNAVREGMVRRIEWIIQYGGSKAIAATRGEGKTEITCGVTLKLTFQGVVDFTVIVAANGKASDRILSNIKYYIETSPRLAEDYPEIVIPILSLEGANQRGPTQTFRGKRTMMKWSAELAVFPRIEGSRASGAIILTTGIDAGLRGLNYRGRRPRLVLIDDPETDQTVTSDLEIQSRIATIENGIAGLAAGDLPMSVVMLNNTPNRRCLGYQFTSPNKYPAWRGERLSLVQSWPVRMDLWSEYVSRRKREMITRPGELPRQTDNWYLENREAMDETEDQVPAVVNEFRFDATINPDGQPTEYSAIQAVFNKVADKGWRFVNAELQCDPPEETESEDWVTAEDAAEKYVDTWVRGVVPEWCEFLTAAVDCGKYALHWVLTAWKKDGTCHVVDYGVQAVLGTKKNIDEGVVQAIQTAIVTLAKERFLKSYPVHGSEGQTKAVDRVLIDSNYKNTAIYNAIKQLKNPRIGACIGDDSRTAPSGIKGKIKSKPSSFQIPGLESCQSFQDAHNVRLWLTLISSDWWKQTVRDAITTAHGHPGSLSIFCEEDAAATDHTEFCEHIADQRWNAKKNRFISQANRDHYADALYYSFVAGSQCGVSRFKTENRGQSAPKGGGLTLAEAYAKAQERKALYGRGE